MSAPFGPNQDTLQRESENPQNLCVSLCRYSLHFLVQSGLSYSVMVFSGLENMHKWVWKQTLLFFFVWVQIQGTDRKPAKLVKYNKWLDK